MQESMPSYYLSSLESERLEAVRECQFLRVLHFNTGKQAVLVSVSPPILGQDFGVPKDIENVVLCNRHEGEVLFPIKIFPCFVFVARARIDLEGAVVDRDELEIIGWGELYRTSEDARTHSFDN